MVTCQLLGKYRVAGLRRLIALRTGDSMLSASVLGVREFLWQLESQEIPNCPGYFNVANNSCLRAASCLPISIMSNFVALAFGKISFCSSLT